MIFNVVITSEKILRRHKFAYIFMWSFILFILYCAQARPFRQWFIKALKEPEKLMFLI
jgi:hypothetical protein